MAQTAGVTFHEYRRKWDRITNDLENELDRLDEEDDENERLRRERLRKAQEDAEVSKAAAGVSASAAALRARSAVARLKAKGSTATTKHLQKAGRREAMRKATEELVKLDSLRKEMDGWSTKIDACLEAKAKARTLRDAGDDAGALARYHELAETVAGVLGELPSARSVGGAQGEEKVSRSTYADESKDEAELRKKYTIVRSQLSSMRDALGKLRRSALVGKGTCQRELGLLHESAETLKVLLLEDPENLRAWVVRGTAYQRMGALLLSELHFNRATQVGVGTGLE